MKKYSLLLLGLITVLNTVVMQTALACAPPKIPRGQENIRLPKMIVSNNGLFLMKMMWPYYTRDSRGRLVEVRKAYGQAFKINRNGQLESLWKVPIKTIDYLFFAGEFFLADDGVQLVKISGVRHLDDKDAMIVYNRGRAFRQYSPRDFISKVALFRTRACHIVGWINADINGSSDVTLHENNISFQTIDGRKWSFDIRKPPALAR